jgi:hypothetical protein
MIHLNDILWTHIVQNKYTVMQSTQKPAIWGDKGESRECKRLNLMQKIQVDLVWSKTPQLEGGRTVKS